MKGVYLLGLLAVVLVLEHFLLTRVYRKRSSLSRLVEGGNSSRADIACWLATLVSGKILILQMLFSVLTLPGLVAAGLYLVQDRIHWNGLLGAPQQAWQQILLFLLARDFLAYVEHRCLHSRILWKYHVLHHSATEFNVLTGNRVSWGERFINIMVITGLLVLLFGVPDADVGLAVVLLIRLLDLIQHSDLPWDFGWLGYIFASPRFHRMHHTLDRADYDRNFGNLFSFWDYLFGTVSRRYREDPTVADDVPLGTPGGEPLSDWRRALLNATLLERWLGSTASQPAPASPSQPGERPNPAPDAPSRDEAAV